MKTITEKQLNECYRKCLEWCNCIKNPILNEVAKRVYADYKEALFNKPATDSHHFYKGGLLYHIYCVTRNAIAICNLYPDLEIDMDLVIFGALTHDIGKTREFNDYSSSTKYTLIRGNGSDLLGHSYEGTHIIENYLSEYSIDEQFKNQVIHMIGSHMNEYSEWGALVLPKMLEVKIINYADSMDAHIEPAHQPLHAVRKGDAYRRNEEDERPYFKSLNPDYNTHRF